MSASRRACDRCHSQKLRCLRNSQIDNDSCSRCSKARARCVYSAPLPTGRPTTNQSSSRRTPVLANHSSLSSESSADAVTWTSTDASNQSQPSMHIDSPFPWDQYLSDFDNTFDPSLLAEHPLVPGPEGSDTPFLPPSAPAETPTTQHSSNNESCATGLPKLWDPQNVDTTETCIRQLSDLNVRLYPVYKTSCRLAAAQKEHPGALYSNATFETVAAFVQGDATVETTPARGCNALHEIFLASRGLLNILEGLLAITSVSASPQCPTNMSSLAAVKTSDRMSIISSNALPPPDGGSFLSQPTGLSASTNNMIMSGSASTPTTPLPGNPLPSAGENGPDGVILHLTLACYLRLLNIYHTLIVVLHRDSMHCNDTGSGSSSFCELRLVLFVQLIKHLLERLNNAMAAYLALQPNATDAMTGLTTTLDVNVLENSTRDELQKLQRRFQR